MIEKLKNVIKSLPQSELFDSQACLLGLLLWEIEWKDAHSREKMDKYYEKRANSANPETCSDFKKLWENDSFML